MGDAYADAPSSTDAHRESWSIFYDDVRVGTIGKRAGVLVEVDQWGWSLGFYPGLEPGQHRSGSAATFDQARGEKLPSEMLSSLMSCVCGVTFDSQRPAESYDHRMHIYATQAKRSW